MQTFKIILILIIMTTVNWGLLGKSAVDPEKIEEAVVRLIQVHNDDETSHLETGQALQSHKASEIIDHLANSIIADKILNREITTEKLSDFSKLRWSFSLESLDAWTEHADLLNFPGELYMQTGNIINTVKQSMCESSEAFDTTKNRTSQFVFKLDQITDQIFYIASGYITDDYGEAEGMGFKVVNNTLYAFSTRIVAGVKTEYLTQMVIISANSINVVRLKYIPDISIKFYLNDNLLATHAENLPNPDYGFGALVNIYLKNTAATNKYVHIYQIYLTKDL